MIYSSTYEYPRASVTVCIDIWCPTAQPAAGPHLHSAVLQRLVRVGHILHGDAVELALVDVRQSIVLAPLAGRNRRLHEETEAEVGETANITVISYLPSLVLLI